MGIKDKINRRREEKDSLFKSHPQSPIPEPKREEFEGLNYYPVNLSLRFELELHEHEEKKTIEVGDSKGGTQEYLRWGEFRFEVNGEEYILQAYKSDPQDQRLWVPFKDKTNGNETYGAGRYIDLEPSEHRKGGKWILDFNEAYNPSCVYNEGFVCPFIPPENWLDVEIEAGEKNYENC